MNPILQVDFTAPAPRPVRKDTRWQHQGGGDYVDRRTGNHYENVRLNGRYTWRKLNATTHAAALKEIRKKRSDLELSKLGLAKDPYSRRPEVFTVTNLLDEYESAGFPKKRNITSKRSERELAEQRRNVANLKQFFRNQIPAEISKAELVQYHAWRIKQIATAKLRRNPEADPNSRPGNRAVDKERVTLSLAFDYAIDRERETGIKTNPFARKVTRFSDPSQIIHCRDRQPENADELHRLAETFFESQRSEVLAWQLLYSSLIGQRSHEILRLRTDAKNQYEPGFIEKKCLYLFRSSSSKGTYPYAEIRAELRQCLDAHQNWLRVRYPNGTPWYFPSPQNARKPLGPSALTHGLARITKELGLPHRTSHGCGRAYFINCLRTDRRADGTHRYTDGEIALRVGQETQGKLISSVYGKIPPYQLTFVPESSPPSWARWLPAAGIRAEQLTLGL